jgi:hypothetical protein
MTDPHTESGSQDVVVISATESLVSLHDVTALRFLLRQPSPNWRTFNVEEITVKILKIRRFFKMLKKRSQACSRWRALAGTLSLVRSRWRAFAGALSLARSCWLSSEAVGKNDHFKNYFLFFSRCTEIH